MDELEEFSAYADEASLADSVEYEGSNASRFALVASLGRESEPRLTGPDGLGENFERFGLNPELLPRNTDWDGREDTSAAEVDYLAGSVRGSDRPEQWRLRAWRDLNERGDRAARLAFLVSGLVSPLERASATAAVAILNGNVSGRQPVPEITWPYGWWFAVRAFRRLGVPAPWEWLGVPPVEDDNEPMALPWNGQVWAELGSFGIREAIGAGDESLALVLLLARWRIEIARRSADNITREISAAAFLLGPFDGGEDVARYVGAATPSTSTMIHGTRAWKGDWWYRRGDFHDFIKEHHRPDLYDGGAPFSWSGALSDRHRRIAGDRFKDWADEIGGKGGLATVFAHSYGAEVAARAINAGARVDEVVFLSAPIHGHHRRMLDRVRRVIDVRLRHDLILTLATLYSGASHRLPRHDKVTVAITDRLPWSHSVTHSETFWNRERIAETVAL